MNFNECKLIIFDCDDVLVDSEIVANRIEAEALISKGSNGTKSNDAHRFDYLYVRAVLGPLTRQFLLEKGINILMFFLESNRTLYLRLMEQ